MKPLVTCAALLLASCASQKVVPVAPPEAPPKGLEAAMPGSAIGGKPEKKAKKSADFTLPEALQKPPDQLEVKALPFDPPAPRIETLPNGLMVYLLEDHTVPLVNFRALVKLGSVDEPADQVGITDLLTSCMRSCGAGELSSEKLDDTLEFMAAILGGGTVEEFSDLSLNVRGEEMDPGLKIFLDVLRRPRFEEKPFAELLSRAAEGIKRREDSPGGLGSRAFEKAIYGAGHPLSREPSLQSLAKIKRADLVALHQKAFVPGGTRLLLTGDFKAEEMLAKVKAATADWKTGPGIDRKLPPPTAVPKREVILIPRPVPQTKVRLGELGFVRHDPREYALRLLDAVLGSSSGPTRLYNEIRDRRGLAYNVGSVMSPGTVKGVFMVAADTKPESTVDLIRETLKIVEGIRGESPVTREELARAKDGYVNAFAFRFDSPEKAVFERALHDFYGYPADYFKTFREKISAVTPEQVTAAAREVIDPAALKIVVVGDPTKVGDLSSFGPLREVKDVAAMRE